MDDPYFYSDSEICSSTNTCFTDVDQTDTSATAKSNISDSWQYDSDLNGNTITSTIDAAATSEASYTELKIFANSNLQDVRTGTYSFSSPASPLAKTKELFIVDSGTTLSVEFLLEGEIANNPDFPIPSDYEPANIDFSILIIRQELAALTNYLFLIIRSYLTSNLLLK